MGLNEVIALLLKECQLHGYDGWVRPLTASSKCQRSVRLRASSANGLACHACLL